MRAFTATVFAAVAAVALAAAPANAHQHFHGGHGWGGAGLAFGLAAGALFAAGVAADEYCVHYVPEYDDYGNYVGRRPVNEC